MKHLLTILSAIAALLLSPLAANQATAQVETVSLNIAKTRDFNLARAAELYEGGQYRDAEAAFKKAIAQNPDSPFAYLGLAKLYGDYESYFSERMANLDKAIELSKKNYPSLLVAALYERSMANLYHGDRNQAFEDARLACNLCLKMEGRFVEAKSLGPQALAYSYIGTNNDFERGCDYLRKAVEIAPFDVNARYLLVDALLYAGYYAEAREHVAIGLKLDPTHKRLLRDAATLASYEGDFAATADNVLARLEEGGISTNDDEVWGTWRQIMSIDPLPLILKLKAKMAANPMVSTWPELLGWAYVQLTPANNALAAQYFHKAYDIAGRDIDLYFECTSLYNAGDLTAALSALDKYLTVDSTYARAYSMRANINSMLDRKQTVLADYDKAISLRPDEEDFYYQKAWFERYNGMTEEAILDMTTAIQKSGGSTHYYLTRGNIFAQIGEKDLAREDFETACDVARRTIDHLSGSSYDTATVANECQQYAFALFAVGDTVAALREMQRGQATTADELNGALYNKACLLSLMGRKQDALAALSQAVDAGYDECVHLGRDNDLDNIRSTKEFDAILAKAKQQFSAKISTATAKPKTSRPDATPEIVEIPFSRSGGVLTIPCTVNGLPLQYIFDSGAADVSISLTEARFMLRNGYLKPQDLGDKVRYGIASGGSVEGMIINLKSITFGGVTLHDVKASITGTQSAPLLLGQSAMSRYGTATIDYDKGVIRLTRNAQ